MPKIQDAKVVAKIQDEQCLFTLDLCYHLHLFSHLPLPIPTYVLTFPPPPSPLQVWDRESLECTKVLKGHTGSVLCLQYDEQVIVTGSSDATIRCVVMDSHLLCVHILVSTTKCQLIVCTYVRTSLLLLCMCKYILEAAAYTCMAPATCGAYPQVTHVQL